MHFCDQSFSCTKPKFFSPILPPKKFVISRGKKLEKRPFALHTLSLSATAADSLPKLKSRYTLL